VTLRAAVAQIERDPDLRTGGRMSRGFESLPLRDAVGLCLATLLLAGCSLLERPPFETTLPALNDLPPLPVRLIDNSGTITALEAPILQPGPPPGGPLDNFAVAVPGRPNRVFVVWLGGLCDERVDIEYTGGDTTFTITTLSAQGGCRLAGIRRSVIVTFASPISAETLIVQQLR
jgi:hypothetical protein